MVLLYIFYLYLNEVEILWQLLRICSRIRIVKVDQYYNFFFAYILVFIMPLRHSSEDLSNTGRHPECGICCTSVAKAAYSYTTACGHVFHKSCLTNHTKTCPNCPVCDTVLTSLSMSTAAHAGIAPSPMGTRSQTQRAREFDSSRAGIQNTTSPHSNEEADVAATVMNQGDNPSTSQNFDAGQTDPIRSMVEEAVRAQHDELLATVSQRLSSLIETNLAAGFSRLNTVPQDNISSRHVFPPPSTPVEVRTIERLLGLPENNNDDNRGNPLNHSQDRRHGPTSDRQPSSHSYVSLRPDKAGHIILNWRIKFTGDSNGMSIDNFLYRVEALTNQTLNGDFDLLCGHISTLFDAKASDFYWRYHRSVSRIRWPDLCRALRKQYRDTRTDVDFREMIRDRKQRSGESFDTFYEAIVSIADKLSEPLSENVLVEILRRNLLPEIQHEILNLHISSVSHLREICRRREFFMQDVARKQTFSKPVGHRGKINEILDAPLESSEENEEQVSAISLVCWNCQKTGHRYHDCMEDRRVFCYGCGASNVYRPKCSVCSSKNSSANAPKGACKPLKNPCASTD